MKIIAAKKILAANDRLAAANRRKFDTQGIFCLNLLGSPGCGKTSLIEALAEMLTPDFKPAVIEGDLATSRDADRISALGLPVFQINTGGGCHLDAGMIARALEKFPLKDCNLLFIENVGNLVCPANYRLGEHLRIALLSAPEGDDKIAKYPTMFQQVDAVILNKSDLIPHLTFDENRVLVDLKMLAPALDYFKISAHTREGLPSLVEWLRQKFAAFQESRR